MKNSLISLAKGKGKALPAKVGLPLNSADKKAMVKKPVPKVVEKPKTKEEERDEKAKETVEKLLQGVEFTSIKPVVEIEEPIKAVQGEGVEWLEEQVTSLTEQCDLLKAEANEAKENYARLFQDYQKKGSSSDGLGEETAKQNVLFLFKQLQANMFGQNPQHEVYEFIYIKPLLVQLMQLFPFTEEYRQF